MASSEEQKNVDVAITIPAAGSAASARTVLNPLAQGTTATTRLGRRVHMKSIYIRGFAQVAPTTTGGASLRILVVYDKQCNGAAAAATDVTVTDVYAAQNNLSNSRRFLTLFDHVTDHFGTAGPMGVPINLYKKLNLDVEFNAGNAGDVTDISTGAVLVFVWMSAGALATANPSSTINSRIRFTDA